MKDISGKEVKVIKGLPALALLPARNWEFKRFDNVYAIEVPVRGLYVDLDPEFFSEDDGGFDLYDEETGKIDIPTINKVMLGTKRYPALTNSQLFTVISIKVTGDVLVVEGMVIDMVGMVNADGNSGVKRQ